MHSKSMKVDVEGGEKYIEVNFEANERSGGKKVQRKYETRRGQKFGHFFGNYKLRCRAYTRMPCDAGSQLGREEEW